MVDTADRLISGLPVQVVEVEPRRQHVLQRPVVQALGEVAAFPLLQVHELVEQAVRSSSSPPIARHAGPLDP